MTFQLRDTKVEAEKSWRDLNAKCHKLQIRLNALKPDYDRLIAFCERVEDNGGDASNVDLALFSEEELQFQKDAEE